MHNCAKGDLQKMQRSVFISFDNHMAMDSWAKGDLQKIQRAVLIAFDNHKAMDTYAGSIASQAQVKLGVTLLFLRFCVSL